MLHSFYEFILENNKYKYSNLTFSNTSSLKQKGDKHKLVLFVDGKEAVVFYYYLHEPGYYSETTNKEYDNGLLVDAGAYTSDKYRGNKFLNLCLCHLLLSLPENCVAQFSVTNENLFDLFYRLGFKDVDVIDYWNKTDNNIENIIDSNTRKLIETELKNVEKNFQNPPKRFINY